MESEIALLKIIQKNAQLQQDGPGPSRVLVMSGPPLSGKSHLVGLIEKRVPGRFLLVRSDEVRPIVSKCLGRQRPAYDDIEHVTTFMVASEVVRAGLSLNWPVIVDATNLKEEFRRWAYVPADDLKASTIVVFMQVTDEIAIARLSERDRDGSAATFNVYQKLKYEMEPVDRCTRPYLVINSDGDMRPHAKNLADWLTGKVDTVPGLKNRVHEGARGKGPAPGDAGKESKITLVDFYTGEVMER
ncbi:MAG: ATP-binding protein [Candidatus Thermoplasmatota archaeon]|nr:ATP-binding protein [Euryarchaeota archaeon]MBU4031732.1 ATP-binding protein [Candidatus Thermoplasmatota archaeon]MBU4071327.1 ATP-binding protein [Candidatus Thermoplasmatota archaeon]MBU4144451.1 ATP-binding protein [Candidatus Thermoplasmatota archaeon]MBU4592317.1 ATP-binding protein [Candidatus Thermoplasmatota archaeon]